MPYVIMSEIWTPLKMFGIRFYKSYDGDYFFKKGNSSRKRLKLGRYF